MVDLDNIAPVGYSEMKRRVKILKVIAVVLTILSLLSVPVSVFGIVSAPELETALLGPVLPIFVATICVILLISSAISIATIWILHAVIKKRIEQGKRILPVVIAIVVAWAVPNIFSIMVNAVSALIENNLNHFI